MSESNPSGNVDSASGASNENADQKTVSYDSYAKLLGEKKKLQASVEADRAKLAEYEQGKLEAEGKLKEALENQKKMTQDSQSKYKDLFQTVASKNLKQQFLREAEKLGCADAELAYLAVNFEDVEITQDLEFDQSKIASKIQDLAKNKPLLFKKDVKMPNDLTPSGGVLPKKSLAEMSVDELTKTYKELSLK